MTRNPYAHPIEEPEPDLPQRVSGLAVTALVFGLLCCIPGSGILGVIFGAAALIRISGAGSRLTGKAMAIVGLVLGLLSSVVWIAVPMGIMVTMSGMHVYGDAVGGMTTGNVAQARAMIEPTTSAKLSDDRLREFGSQIVAEHGAYQGMPKGLMGWIQAYGALANDIEKATAQAGSPNRVLPLPLRFDKGYALAVFELDPRSPGPQGASQASEIGIVMKDGRVMWLVAPAATSKPPTSSTGPTGTTGSASPPATGPP